MAYLVSTRPMRHRFKNQGRELLKNGHPRLTSDLHRHVCAYTNTLKIKMKRSQLRLKAVRSIQKREQGPRYVVISTAAAVTRQVAHTSIDSSWGPMQD